MARGIRLGLAVAAATSCTAAPTSDRGADAPTTLAALPSEHRAWLAQSPRGGSRSRLIVATPVKASGATRVADGDSGAAVEYFLEGATNATCVREGHLHVCERATDDGADLFRRFDDRGQEDFLYFHARPRHERVSHRIDLEGVAGMRLVSRSLELLDATGTPRLRVAPPFVVDRNGVVHRADLSLEGCAYDVDPRGPWGRAVTPPGASTCSVVVAWRLDDERYPALVDPLWTSARDLATPRSAHRANLLDDGRLLVHGGSSNAGLHLADSELFDPVTDTTSPTGAMVEAGAAHRSVVLADGRVLAVGGDLVAPWPPVSTAHMQRYDRATGEWTLLAPMPSPRSLHTVTRLADGRVLIAGGWDNVAATALKSVLLCDAQGEACEPRTSMGYTRATHTATLLPDGRVLVVGGSGNPYVEPPMLYRSTTELYDPALDVWIIGPELAAPRGDHAALLLPDQRLLVLGGSSLPQGFSMLDAAEVLDAELTSWVDAGDLFRPRWLFAASQMPNGRILLTGTAAAAFAISPNRDAEVFDPATGNATEAGQLDSPTFEHSSTQLNDGRVAVIGGQIGPSPQVSDHVDLFGTRLGDPCDVEDDTSCPNGYCIGGICSATAEGSGGAGSGGGGGTASGGGDVSGSGAAATAASPETNFLVCAARPMGARDRSGRLATAIALAVLLVAMRRVSRRGSQSRTRGPTFRLRRFRGWRRSRSARCRT